jgi:hypothetical protein
MPSYAKSTPEQLRKRLDEIERDLESLAPALFAEMKLVQRLLEASKTGPGTIFANVRSVIGAIELCFQIRGQWMTKQEIFDMISEGGFELKPRTGKYLIADSLNYHVKRGRVARHGDLYGSPDWKKPKQAIS